MNRPVCALALALLSLPVALAAAGPAYPQAEPVVPFGQQTHAFRYVLNDLGFTPLKDVNELVESPKGSLLIVFGDVSILDRIPGGLRKFVENGGAVLVATDRAVQGGALVQSFGVKVGRQPVKVRGGDTTRSYRGLEDCPIVQPVPDAPIPLFAKLRSGVATNRAGYLQVELRRGRMLHLLARFPDGWSYARPVNRDVLMQLGVLPFSAGRQWGQGRILVLADHSVFINDMMLQQDNSNIDFTYNALVWLRGPEEQRSRVLLVDEGSIIPDFQVNMKQMPLPPVQLPPDMVGFANETLDDLGKDDLLNKEILGMTPAEQRWRMASLFRWGTLALTGGLLLYGFFRLARARHRVEPGAPLLAPAVASLAPAGGVLEQRHDALVVQGNLAEPARELTRQFFTSLLGERAGGPMPTLRFTGGLLQRKRLRESVRRLWDMAFSTAPVRVSREEFAGLAARLEEVRSAVERSVLTLE